jgi:hypothetical protein
MHGLEHGSTTLCAEVTAELPQGPPGRLQTTACRITSSTTRCVRAQEGSRQPCRQRCSKSFKVAAAIEQEDERPGAEMFASAQPRTSTRRATHARMLMTGQPEGTTGPELTRLQAQAAYGALRETVKRL